MEILAIILPEAWSLSSGLDPSQILVIERAAQKLKAERRKKPQAIFTSTRFPMIQAADIVHDEFSARLRASAIVDEGKFSDLPTELDRVWVVLSESGAAKLPSSAEKLHIGKG